MIPGSHHRVGDLNLGFGGIQEIRLHLRRGPTGGFIPDSVRAIVSDGKRRVEVTPREAILRNMRFTYDDSPSIDGTVYIDWELRHSPHRMVKFQGYYLSPAARNSLLVRLLLLNEPSPAFRLVHSSNGLDAERPAALRIWEAAY